MAVLVVEGRERWPRPGPNRDHPDWMMPLARPAAGVLMEGRFPSRSMGGRGRAPRPAFGDLADGRSRAMAATNQAGARDVAPSQAGPTGDPLGSWREGASKRATLDFVQRGTAEGGAEA